MKFLCPGCHERVEICGCAAWYALTVSTPESTTQVAVCSEACQDKVEAEAKARNYRRVAL